MTFKPALSVVFLSLLLVIGCSVTRPKKGLSGNASNESNTISFIVLNIHRDSVTLMNVVNFVSKKESTGKIKRQSFFPASNSLTIYSYSGKRTVDSLSMEHPLYKHIEFVDEHNQLSVKDTVIQSAEFFVRMQGYCDELKIIEKLYDNLPRQLNRIKL